MALHLVGETLDKNRSHSLAEAGKLVQLMRGIYVDADDDIDATVLRHAVRIARYLYPKAYLSAASAILLAPTRHGRLFLSSRRIQRTRIRGLEIIQNKAPKHPSTGTAVIDDGMGEFRVEVSSIRQRFLESFRLRSEHASSIDDGMREAIATRLVEEYGSARGAADAVRALARENEWIREGELAERFLSQQRGDEDGRNKAALDLVVAWHGSPIGNLAHDGFEWRWTLRKGPTAPLLVRQTTPGKLPPFLSSLLPEGWLEKLLQNRDERATLRTGKRYMSNITIVERESDLAALSPDVLLARLEKFARAGVFTGRYEGPAKSDVEKSFESNLAQIYAREDTPRLSGIQIKAPMYLDKKGVLSPSAGKPFTHILKPAGTSGYESLPIAEWMAMSLGKAAGFKVPDTALIEMPDGMPPALLVERFDIRTSTKDKRMLALEDLCSVLDLPTSAKYDGSMERVARAVRALSTTPEQDLVVILQRGLFAWLIADGDMHLKNMALLKIAEPGAEKFHSVRMAPLYDAVTTRVFPRLAHDPLALTLNGKKEKLGRKDFRTFASTAGLKAGAAEAAIAEMIEKLASALNSVALPQGLNCGPECARVAEQVLEICRARIQHFV